MNTDKITVLCNTSNRLSDNKTKAEKMLPKIDDAALITIRTSYSDLSIRVDDYPELKLFAEKLLKYVIKSEETRQVEIKTEIVKCL